MSEKIEADLSAAAVTETQEQGKDRVGDILRKERITRRITVETIAKDLKLNVRYIKALEGNDYGALPADPYVRVYLRSLAKYLTLDPDDILKKFYDERGLGSELYRKDTSSKLVVNVLEKPIESKNPMLAIALIVIVVLGAFMFMANKKGWVSSSGGSIVSFPDKNSSDSTKDGVSEDSMYAGAPIQPSDSIAVESVAAARKADSTNASILANDSTMQKLKLTVTRDSAWVRIFADGKPWEGVLKAGQDKEFFARDSFNANIGNNSVVKYTYNGKAMRIKGIGVLLFKLDHYEYKTWTSNRWNSVFKGR